MKLKGMEERSKSADPDGEEEKLAIIYLSSPELKKDANLQLKRARRVPHCG